MRYRKGNRFTSAKRIYSKLLPVLAAICICTFNISAVYADKADVREENVSKADTKAQETNNEKLQSKIVSPKNLNQNGYDVIYLIDNSRSVWNQQDVRNKAFRGITNLAAGADINVGIVYFASRIYSDYTKGLTSMETEDGCKSVLNALNMTARDENNIDTNIGNALEAAINMYDGQNPSRQRIVVLFSDGINENSAQDKDYTQKANKKTKKMAQKLEEMNIPLYCVYLQQDRNDENYLKELVNYFSDEKDYTKNRFSKVKASDISSLLPTFTKVFYAMQNNMRYRELNLDSTGTTTFYVPSLGIKKLNIYVNMDTDIEIGVRGDSGEHSWDENSGEHVLESPETSDRTFLTYEAPQSGEWWLRVKNDNFSQAYGTITYYTDLSASVELIPAGTNDEKMVNQYRLKLHFYDENAKEIALDSMANVAVTQKYTGEDGRKNSETIDMNIKKGTAVSKPFKINSYGSYSYNISLGYENFINLNYTISGISLIKKASVTTDTTFGKIIDSDFWKDIKTYVKLFALVIIGVGIVSVFIYFIFLCKVKKVFKKNVDDFDKCEKEIEDTAKQCAQIINNELYRQKNMIEKCLYGNSSAGISGIIKMSENLDDDLYSRFDLAKYTENDFCEKMFKEVEQWKTDLKDILSVVFELKEEELKRRKQTVEKISAHKRRNAMIKVLYHKLGEKLGKVKTIKEKAEKKKEEAEKVLQDIEKTGNEIAALTCNKITCKLTVKDISCCPGVRGVMNARGFNGNYIHRYYSLGAVELITAENLTLEDKTGSLDIYVYGCGDKELAAGEAALKLKGIRNFIIEDDDAEEATPIRTTDILLMAGHTYTLTVEDTQIGSIQMKLVVQQG